jgi:hypothetical protein
VRDPRWNHRRTRSSDIQSHLLASSHLIVLDDNMIHTLLLYAFRLDDNLEKRVDSWIAFFCGTAPLEIPRVCLLSNIFLPSHDHVDDGENSSANSQASAASSTKPTRKPRRRLDRIVLERHVSAWLNQH